MKAHQVQEILVRSLAAAGVALAMIATIHGLTSVSQHHIERDLASFAAHSSQQQLAGVAAASQRG